MSTFEINIDPVEFSKTVSNFIRANSKGPGRLCFVRSRVSWNTILP
jgi:hypothetical protein